jgi:hypothetical protein
MGLGLGLVIGCMKHFEHFYHLFIFQKKMKDKKNDISKPEKTLKRAGRDES